uniref:Uncharacterized protein n=1 Tax=Meloidogyne enterolobii TaxID=390850 RepID=A0A6V7W9P1_MELEN|nr:unnamed protein product [Meloidogyne enterolobii]
MDSRVPFLARGSLEYRVGAEGPLESVQEKRLAAAVEVVDVRQGPLKL